MGLSQGLWDIVKDIAEIAGTVGTAGGLIVRERIRSRVREEKTNNKIDDVMRQIEQLKEVKMDKATQETENRHLHELISDMRSDMKETTKTMSDNIGKMAESLNKLDGTVRTFMDMLKK